jgi:hypothetical protein
VIPGAGFQWAVKGPFLPPSGINVECPEVVEVLALVSPTPHDLTRHDNYVSVSGLLDVSPCQTLPGA